MAFNLKEELQKIKNTALGQKALATISDPELFWDAVGAIGGGVGGYYLNKAFRDTAPSGFSSALAVLAGATAGGAGAHWLQGKIPVSNGLTLREQYRLRVDPSVQKELSERMYFAGRDAKSKDRIKEALLSSTIFPGAELGVQLSRGKLPFLQRYSFFDGKLNARLQSAFTAEQKLADVMLSDSPSMKDAVSALVGGATTPEYVREHAARLLSNPDIGKESKAVYDTLLSSKVYRDAKGVLRVQPATLGRRLGALGKAWGINLGVSIPIELYLNYRDKKRDEQDFLDMQQRVSKMAEGL